MEINIEQKEKTALPPRVGNKWMNDEDDKLLEEISKGLSLIEIAKSHERTEKGIFCRIREIAFKMYSKNNSMNEIMEKTKLSEEEIKAYIEHKKNNTFKSKNINLKNEVLEIKESLKNMIKKLDNILDLIG